VGRLNYTADSIPMKVDSSCCILHNKLIRVYAYMGIKMYLMSGVRFQAGSHCKAVSFYKIVFPPVQTEHDTDCTVGYHMEGYP